MSDLPRFVMCMCTGQCPGFAKLDMWSLINYVRNELDVEYAVIHPQLCVDDGDAFLADLLKHGEHYVIGGCDPRMQRKMFKDVFIEKGLDFEANATPLDLRDMEASQAIAKVKEAVEALAAEA